LLGGEEQPGWTVPVKISSHAHRQRASIFVPKHALRWRKIFLQDLYPKRNPGRPPEQPELQVAPG
jgi:hypothetical protein